MKGHNTIIASRLCRNKPPFVFVNDYPCKTDWFETGELILGHTPVVAVEWEPYACRVLRERAADGWFPGLQVWEGDVRLFNPSEYAGVVDCIHAGFPCQDISVAGKQAGVSEGTRSGLYREVLRIAGIVKPRKIFLENVAAILSNGLGTVLADLAALGYDCRWLCIRASDVGAPHHRDRWFLLANADGYDGRSSGMGQDARTNGRDEPCGVGEVLANTNNGQRQFTEQEICTGRDAAELGGCIGCGYEFDQERLGRNGCPNCKGDFPDPHKPQLQGNGRTVANEAQHSSARGLGWWEVEPGLGRVVNGVSDRVGQLKGYGNAQVPLQAATAYRLLGGV
jgi:DNA (cytosine-5)-methyltransferase 1